MELLEDLKQEEDIKKRIGEQLRANVSLKVISNPTSPYPYLAQLNALSQTQYRSPYLSPLPDIFNGIPGSGPGI